MMFRVFLCFFLPSFVVGVWVIGEENMDFYNILEELSVRTVSECIFKCKENSSCSEVGIRGINKETPWKTCMFLNRTQNVEDFGKSSEVITVLMKVKNATQKHQLDWPSNPVHGNWSEWKRTGSCEVKWCGGGKWRFERRCNNPPPIRGGLKCLLSGSTERGMVDSKMENCRVGCLLGRNVAKNKSATQSSIDFGNVAQYAVDGTTSTYSMTLYDSPGWWRLDLGKAYFIFQYTIKAHALTGNDIVGAVLRSSVKPTTDTGLMRVIAAFSNVPKPLPDGSYGYYLQRLPPIELRYLDIRRSPGTIGIREVELCEVLKGSQRAA